nr:11921_t:CDS:2 [Entrophospora candida]
MSKLPSDCLSEIFSYLENDMSTLHSCILVNRLWCEIAIKYLWKQPFDLTVKTSMNSISKFPNISFKSSLKFIKLTSTLFQCIVYNNNKNKRNSGRGSRGKVVAEILERRVTREFIRSSSSYLNNECILSKLIDNVGRLIILQIKKLDSISMFTTNNNTKSFFWNLYDNLHVCYPEISNRCFSYINRFEWTAGNQGTKFLANLCNTSHNIKVIKIDWDDKWFARDDENLDKKNDDLLVNLIKNQHALEEFHFFFNIQKKIPRIIEGLHHQSSHLRRVVLKRNRIYDKEYMTKILNLEGLEDLTIKYCWLESGENYYKSSMLKEFIYDENYFRVDFESIALYISTHFKNLVYLDLYIYIRVSSLSEILLSCKKLEKIIIKDRNWSQHWHDENNQNLDKLMQEMVLTNLKHLELKGVFHFTATSLDIFLRKSNPPLEVMEIIGSYCFGNDHIEVLLELLNVKLHKLHITTTICPKRNIKSRANKIIRDFKYVYIKPKKTDTRLLYINQQYPNTRSRKKLEVDLIN